MRYSDDDYSKVFVILRNHEACEVCEAELITPTSLVKPNKATLKTVNRARAFERGVFNEFNFIAQSNIRGESLEDRVVRQLGSAEAGPAEAAVASASAAVHKLTRLDHRRAATNRDAHQVTADEVARAEADTTIFSVKRRAGVVGVEDE